MAFLHPLAASALAVGLLIPSGDAGAKTRSLKWDDELCSYSMRYDDAKVDARALVETVELLKSEAATYPTAPFAATPADQRKLDADKFERDCAVTVAKLRGLKMLDLPGLDDYRRERAHLVEDACRFGSTNLRGARDPAVYRTYEPAAPHCASFVDALEGKTSLTEAWRALVDSHCAKNASPSVCKASFQKIADAGPGDAGMRHSVSDFGWNNCAVRHTLFNGERGEANAAVGRRIFEDFRRRFAVRETCETD